MEQTISLPEQSSMDQRKVRIIKIIAFSAFLLGMICKEFRYFLHDELRHLLSNIYEIFSAISWLCLAYLASNKPARIMSCIIALCPIVISIIPIPFPYNSLIWALSDILFIYCLSRILTNMSFSKEERKWSMVLFISYSTAAISQIMFFFRQPTFWRDTELFYNEWFECQYYTSGLYNTYAWILALFIVIGMYKLCFSKSFSGSYDNSAKGTYTPVNKYVIGALVTTIITCGLLCLTLIFWNDIMNLL